MFQDEQIEPQRKLWLARRRTASKQSPPRFILALAKIYAWFLAFPSPPKVRCTFRGPRKLQDFKGKRSDGAALACLQLQTAISDCCDAVERRDLFVAKRHINQEKSNKMRFLTKISDFQTICHSLHIVFFFAFCGLDFFTSPAVQYIINTRVSATIFQ